MGLSKGLSGLVYGLCTTLLLPLCWVRAKASVLSTLGVGFGIVLQACGLSLAHDASRYKVANLDLKFVSRATLFVHSPCLNCGLLWRAFIANIASSKVQLLGSVSHIPFSLFFILYFLFIFKFDLGGMLFAGISTICRGLKRHIMLYLEKLHWL